MDVVIRPAQSEDLDSLWQIYVGAIGQGARRKDEYWQALIQRGGMLIAEMNHQPVGFGAIDIYDREQIKYIYIAHQYQKLGIGAKVLRHLEAIGEQAGLTQLLLHANPAAVDFYGRAGYTAIDSEIDHDHDGVQMIKKLR